MKIVKRVPIVVLSLAALLQFSGCGNDPDWIANLEDEIFARINQLRIDEGLSELVWYTELAEFAADHSSDMGIRDYFSHTTPEGTTFAERIADSEITFGSAGENIYMRMGDCSTIPIQDLAGGVVDAWWNSPGHRSLILAEYMTEGAVGCYQSDDALYVTFNAIN